MPLAAVTRVDLESAVVADGDDAVGLAVDRAAPVALDPGEVPGVAAGLDQVPDAGDGALQAERHAVLGDAAERTSSARSCADSRAACSLVSTSSSDRRPASVSPSQARGGGGLGLLDGAGVDEPALLVVVAQHGLVAVAQPQRRLPAPTSAVNRRASTSS